MLLKDVNLLFEWTDAEYLIYSRHLAISLVISLILHLMNFVK